MVHRTSKQSTKCTWAPPLMEVRQQGTLNLVMRSKCTMGIIFGFYQDCHSHAFLRPYSTRTYSSTGVTDRCDQICLQLHTRQRFYCHSAAKSCLLGSCSPASPVLDHRPVFGRLQYSRGAITIVRYGVMIYERSIVLLTGSHIYMMVSQPEPSTVPPSVGLTQAHPNTNIKMYLEGLWEAKCCWQAHIFTWWCPSKTTSTIRLKHTHVFQCSVGLTQARPNTRH